MSGSTDAYEAQRAAARRRSTAARIGANAMWAATDDWSARTAPARRAFLAKFEDQVDPNRELDPVVRAKKADAALRAHMASLAKNRRKKAKKKAASPKPAA